MRGQDDGGLQRHGRIDPVTAERHVVDVAEGGLDRQPVDEIGVRFVAAVLERRQHGTPAGQGHAGAAVEATELAKDALKKATVCVEATWCQDEATMKLCGMTSATCGKNADGSKDDGSGKPVVPDAAAQADLQVKEDASAVAAAEKEAVRRKAEEDDKARAQAKAKAEAITLEREQAYESQKVRFRDQSRKRRRCAALVVGAARMGAEALLRGGMGLLRENSFLNSS